MENKKTKICFIGNCQARTMREIAAANGYDTKYYMLCSTVLAKEHGIEACKRYLSSFLSEEEINNIVHSGELRINPSVSDLSKDKCNIFIYNLFHEQNKYYVHKKYEFILQYDCAHKINQLSTKILQRLVKDFDIININYKDYIERFTNFILQSSYSFQEGKHYVISRISEAMVSDKCKSYLKNWNSIQHKANEQLARLESRDNIFLINTDNITSDYIAKFGLQGAFPIKVSKRLTNNNYIFTPYYDLEHPSRYYWSSVFNSINFQQKNESIPTAEKDTTTANENIVIEKRNKLINSILREDQNTTLELLKEIKPHEIAGNLDAIEAAIFLLRNTAHNNIKKILTSIQEEKNKFTHLQRITAKRLLQLYSSCKILPKLKENAKIAFFGAGGQVGLIADVLQSEHNIICIYDNDKAKHGLLVSSIPVITPDTITAEQTTPDYIIITSSFVDEIAKQILQHPQLKYSQIISSQDILDYLILHKEA
ncbi:MAG: hypothetical protein V3573_06245 [Desulfovibrionaceae bacterium]